MDDDCQPPKIDIGLNKTLSQALSITTLQSLQLEARLSMRCKKSNYPIYVWETSAVDNTNKQFLPFITHAKNVKSLTFQPRMLALGYHYIRLKADMQGIKGTWAYDFGFIEIVLPRLVSVISGPSSSVQGSGPLILNAENSFDPDLSGPSRYSGLSYKWFCRRTDESLSNITSSPIDLPLKKPQNQGGCFGYGPGRLRTTSELLQLDPAVMKAKHRYVIELLVTKGKRSSLIASHTVYIITALQFSIK